MCQPVTGLGSDAIPACNAVKTLPIKEPAEAQKDEEGEGKDFSGSCIFIFVNSMYYICCVLCNFISCVLLKLCVHNVIANCHNVIIKLRALDTLG